MFLMFSDKEISNIDQMQMTSVSGKHFITPEVHQVAIHRNGIANKFKKLGLIVESVKVEGISKSRKFSKSKYNFIFFRV